MRSKFLPRFSNQFDGGFIILEFLFSGRTLLEETGVNMEATKGLCGFILRQVWLRSNCFLTDC